MSMLCATRRIFANYSDLVAMEVHAPTPLSQAESPGSFVDVRMDSAGSCVHTVCILFHYRSSPSSSPSSSFPSSFLFRLLLSFTFPFFFFFVFFFVVVFGFSSSFPLRPSSSLLLWHVHRTPFINAVPFISIAVYIVTTVSVAFIVSKKKVIWLASKCDITRSVVSNDWCQPLHRSTKSWPHDVVDSVSFFPVKIISKQN